MYLKISSQTVIIKSTNQQINNGRFFVCLFRETFIKYAGEIGRYRQFVLVWWVGEKRGREREREIERKRDG